jgi:hypothetical protein
MAGGQRLISWLHLCSTSNVALNTRTYAHGPLMGHPNWAGCDNRVGQAGGYNSHTTSVPESLSDFSRPRNKNTSKTQPAQKENPTQNLTKQLLIDQEQTSSTKTQRDTSQAVHPRKIPQVASTGQTGQEHPSDRCNLGSSGRTAPVGQLLQIQTLIS